MTNKHIVKVREYRTITSDALRNLCIEKNWYTCGNNEEYGKLLESANKSNISADDIWVMATDIKKHSDTEHEIDSICFEIARKCISHFERW